MAAYEEATGHILIIYQRSNPNLFMDFMTWVRLQAQDKKEIQKKMDFGAKFISSECVRRRD